MYLDYNLGVCVKLLGCAGAFTIWAKLAAALRNNLVFYAVLTVGPLHD